MTMLEHYPYGNTVIYRGQYALSEEWNDRGSMSVGLRDSRPEPLKVQRPSGI
jgi:hypothetical protein